MDKIESVEQYKETLKQQLDTNLKKACEKYADMFFDTPKIKNMIETAIVEEDYNLIVALEDTRSIINILSNILPQKQILTNEAMLKARQHYITKLNMCPPDDCSRYIYVELAKKIVKKIEEGSDIIDDEEPIIYNSQQSTEDNIESQQSTGDNISAPTFNTFFINNIKDSTKDVIDKTTNQNVMY